MKPADDVFIVVPTLVERAIAHGEEMLMHKQSGIVFVGNIHALFILFIRITRELMVDEHSVLVVIAQFQTIINLVGCHHVKLLARRRDDHLPVVVARNIYLLENGNERAVARHVISVISPHGVIAVRPHTNHSPFIAHAQNGMHSINLVVPLHVALY